MDAFVLAGGVVKGAFTAGALAELIAASASGAIALRPRRIVAASAGALNGAYLAAALHRGTLATAGEAMVRIWTDEATFRNGFEVSLRGIVTLAGMSTSQSLRRVLERHLTRVQTTAVAAARERVPIELLLVVANANGTTELVGGSPATTFEHVFRFDGAAFESEARLGELITAVCASAAFPGAFLPVTTNVRGTPSPCFDGGTVNNAPLKHAIGEARDVKRVFLISPFPRVLEPPARLSGFALLSHLAEMLINERLFRDLKETEAVNRTLARLDAALPDPMHRAAALGALGWTGRCPIDIVEIRPPAPLAGHAFSGVLSRDLRESYVAAGREAARAWLSTGRDGATGRRGDAGENAPETTAVSAGARPR